MSILKRRKTAGLVKLAKGSPSKDGKKRKKKISLVGTSLKDLLGIEKSLKQKIPSFIVELIDHVYLSGLFNGDLFMETSSEDSLYSFVKNYTKDNSYLKKQSAVLCSDILLMIIRFFPTPLIDKKSKEGLYKITSTINEKSIAKIKKIIMIQEEPERNFLQVILRMFNRIIEMENGINIDKLSSKVGPILLNEFVNIDDAIRSTIILISEHDNIFENNTSKSEEASRHLMFNDSGMIAINSDSSDSLETSEIKQLNATEIIDSMLKISMKNILNSDHPTDGYYRMNHSYEKWNSQALAKKFTKNNIGFSSIEIMESSSLDRDIDYKYTNSTPTGIKKSASVSLLTPRALKKRQSKIELNIISDSDEDAPAFEPLQLNKTRIKKKEKTFSFELSRSLSTGVKKKFSSSKN